MLSEEDKQWVINEIIDGRESPATIARAFNPNRKTVSYWVCKARNNISVHSSVERLPRLSEIALEQVSNEIKGTNISTPHRAFTAVFNKVGKILLQHNKSILGYNV